METLLLSASVAPAVANKRLVNDWMRSVTEMDLKTVSAWSRIPASGESNALRSSADNIFFYCSVVGVVKESRASIVESMMLLGKRTPDFFLLDARCGWEGSREVHKLETGDDRANVNSRLATRVIFRGKNWRGFLMENLNPLNRNEKPSSASQTHIISSISFHNPCQRPTPHNSL